MIYVTHDQTEAMTMADRIVVINAGVIEQIGSPLDLYNRPGNLFVAGFLGSPRMNFFKARVADGTSEPRSSPQSTASPRRCRFRSAPAMRGRPRSANAIVVGVRPEAFRRARRYGLRDRRDGEGGREPRPRDAGLRRRRAARHARLRSRRRATSPSTARSQTATAYGAPIRLAVDLRDVFVFDARRADHPLSRAAPRRRLTSHDRQRRQKYHALSPDPSRLPHLRTHSRHRFALRTRKRLREDLRRRQRQFGHRLLQVPSRLVVPSDQGRQAAPESRLRSPARADRRAARRRHQRADLPLRRLGRARGHASTRAGAS